MATSSQDLMSSPDPLQQSIPSSAATFTRRITRSQLKPRLPSLPTTSPRKQTFELDVGNDISPQKIVVTVEAESERDNVSRRLFTSPTRQRSAARRREKTTTTKIPLRGMTDDEGASTAATPRRRGRPPRSATPTPGARKRAGTPQNTPRQTRRAKTGNEEPASEASLASSRATSTNRTRRTPAKKAPASAKKPAAKDAADTQPKKRGRPRRQALVPEEMEALAEQDNFESTIVVSDHSESVAEEDPVSQREPSPAPYGGGDHDDPEDDGEDIWMANLSEPPTPVPQRRSPRRATPSDSGSIRQSESDAGFPGAPRSETGDTESDAPMEMDDRNDAGSYISENPAPNRSDIDTIAQGEDFSMIAFDSMQSYQANTSMRNDMLPEMGETTSLIVSRTLDSLRQSVGDRVEEAADEGENPDLEATPKASSSVHIPTDQHRPTSDGPLFSQPASPQGWSRSPRRTRATPLGKQLALKSLQRDSPAARPPGRPFAIPGLPQPSGTAVEAEDQSMYDDSFSEIPEAVLEAATPRRIWNRHMGLEDESELPADEEENQEDDHEDMESPTKSSVASVGARSESSRLLTPDDTPSPIGAVDGEERANHQPSDVAMASVVRSSPLAVGVSRAANEETTSRHSRQSSNETPLASALSPQLPPAPAIGVEAYLNSLTVLSELSRPALSPIVRAGRALQNVTSDPPSPKDRESQLGSPFRGTQSPVGSNREASQPPKSPTPNPPRQQPSAPKEGGTWSKAFAPLSQLKNLVVQGAQVFSPRVNKSVAMEDPFALGEDQPQPSDAEMAPSNRASSPVEEAAFRASMSMSTRAGPPSEDGMDWEADPPAPRAMQQGTSRSVSSVFATRGSNDGRTLGMGFSDEPVLQHGQEMEDDGDESDEEDIWAFEAQRATPAADKANANASSTIPPRRSKLPSPWRKNSKGLFYSDEVSNQESPALPANLPSEQASRQDAFSLLSTQSGADPKQVVQENAPPKSKVNLSAFFSSPAIIPQLQRPGEAPQPAQRPRAPSNLIKQTVNPVAKVADDAGFMRPQSRRGIASGPQTLFQQNTDLPSLPQKGFFPSTQRRTDLFSSVRSQPAAPSQDAQDHPTSPSTPERPVLPHITQKQNFTPRQRDSGNSLFKPLPAKQPQPQVIQLSSDPLTEEELADSSHLTDESSFEAPALKPLPGKLASPTKSSFRSPLKPKTPGRVVEFTSSVLSPLEQAQARAERERSAAAARAAAVPNPAGISSWGQSFATNPQMRLRPQPSTQQRQQAAIAEMLLDPAEADKENSHSPDRLAAKTQPSLRLQAPAPQAQQLRAGSWSRAHWLRLDELVQERRRDGALNFQLRHPARAAKNGGPTMPGRRPSAALLGKQVTAQGETMALEQWHLDVVDAFGAEPLGAPWAEKDLAKRVFALLVGEERRRLGLVPSRR